MRTKTNLNDPMIKALLGPNSREAIKAEFAAGVTPDLPKLMRTLTQAIKEARTPLKTATPLGDDDRQWLTEIKSAAEAMLAEIQRTLGQPTASEKEHLKAQSQTLRLQSETLGLRVRMRGLNH
jgi:hypothetical protein